MLTLHAESSLMAHAKAAGVAVLVVEITTGQRPPSRCQARYAFRVICPPLFPPSQSAVALPTYTAARRLVVRRYRYY